MIEDLLLRHFPVRMFEKSEKICPPMKENSRNVFSVDQTLRLFEQPWGSSERKSVRKHVAFRLQW